MISGAEGAIRWGYYTASTVKHWSIETVEGVQTLRGTLEAVDAFRIAQRPLLFVVTRAAHVWSWPIETITIDGAQGIARLGAQV
jgi:hypothetical protein